VDLLRSAASICTRCDTCNVATLTTRSTPAVEHVGMDGLDVYRLDAPSTPQQLSPGGVLKGDLATQGLREVADVSTAEAACRQVN
jgi:hypothetical protein